MTPDELRARAADIRQSQPPSFGVGMMNGETRWPEADKLEKRANLIELIDEVESWNCPGIWGDDWPADAVEETRALADRCLLARGWSYKLPITAKDHNDLSAYVWYKPDGSFHGKTAPNPILSRDDADALLPEGWWVYHLSGPKDKGGRWICHLTNGHELLDASAYTEPCARTAAALRAELREMQG